ncbi:MAG: hypothetical protein FWG77_09775 [Treponema sp.]|nr:hypothetical protein [Treponema sp.]
MKKFTFFILLILIVCMSLPASTAGLILGEDLSGRITIRDSLDIIVVELNKIGGNTLTLGFDPGSYSLTLQQGNDFYRADITLNDDAVLTLTMGNFFLIAASYRDPDDEDVESEFRRWRNPFGNSLYTFFFNIVDEDFRFPLIGFFNLSVGNFSNVQAGFVNWNTRNLTGIQAAYINTVGGDLSGLQAGFINTTAGNTNGFQAGFVNTTGSLNGFQAGFVNTALGSARGFQAGFINSTIRSLSGVQLGFINYADSVDGGLPIGFLSIVREGGYRAFEYTFSEFFPVTLGFKIGIERFYTSFYVGFNPFVESTANRAAYGWGFGSMLPIVGSFFFNPEYVWLNAISEYNYSWLDSWIESFNSIHSLVFNFGYNITGNFSVHAGPSLTWVSYLGDAKLDPLFTILYHEINDESAIALGLRAGLRLSF